MFFKLNKFRKKHNIVNKLPDILVSQDAAVSQDVNFALSPFKDDVEGEFLHGINESADNEVLTIYNPNYNGSYNTGGKNKRKRFKFSIRFKIITIVMLGLFLLISTIWLLNNFVMEKYYVSQKETMLIEKFEHINSLLKENSQASENTLKEELYSLESDYNILLAIQVGPRGNWQSLSDNSVNMRQLPETVALKDGERYAIIPTTDIRSNSEIIALAGLFDDGTKVIMTTPLAPIKESVNVTNRFVLISGGAALVLSLILVLILTGTLTRPIKSLTDIAEKMSRLDFSVKHSVKGHDELSALGESMNLMSNALENSIAHLKSANLRLLSENEMKTKQNEAHKAFISNVSHELKTPLAIISSYAEILRENSQNDNIDPSFYCNVIEDEAAKMDMMIKKMTMLMQLQSGKEELSIERFDIVGLTDSILEKHRLLRDDKKIKVITLKEQGMNEAFVWADPFLIEHVITNYISNAFNHAYDNGEISAKIEILQKSEVVPFNSSSVVMKKHLRLSVYNSGGQIPSDEAGKIWESFYKIDKARTREYGGSGIGLSVVAAIMKAHNAPYGFINREGGVDFFIELESE